MPLGARIAAALHRPAVEEKDTVSLPYDVVRDYLSEHAVVVGLRLDPRTVFDAVVAMTAPDPSEEPAATPPPTAPVECQHCGVGRALIDEHHGCRVCSHCGAVLTEHIFKVQPEFDKDDGVTLVRNFGRRGVPGVSQTLVRKYAAPDPVQPPAFRLLADMQHWNQYTGHSVDALESMHRSLVRRAVAGPHSVRIAAALLQPLLRARLLDTAAVRASVSRGAPLAVVEDPTPQPQHACLQCGAMRHTAKDARFHCRGAFGHKRPRRL